MRRPEEKRSRKNGERKNNFPGKRNSLDKFKKEKESQHIGSYSLEERAGWNIGGGILIQGEGTGKS